MASLTPCTYALSSQIPKNCKVIGGGHRVGQLWKDKQRQAGSEKQQLRRAAHSSQSSGKEEHRAAENKSSVMEA